MDRQGLGGKTAFISGSGRNIGRASALELARRGCNVIVNGASNQALCEETAEGVRALGVKSLVVMGDISKRETVAELAEKAFSQFGRVDIVVNNAAIRPHKPFLETTEEEWHRIIGIDLHASFHTIRTFLPGMIDAGWGRVVNITGMHAIHGYMHRAPISAAKHGLWGMTKALAKEFGPNGVTVNAISPGTVRDETANEEIARAKQANAANIPVGHIGEPDDIAGVVGFLCSDAARFVTGQMIAANGGVQT